MQCDLCPKKCSIDENGFGFCGVRKNDSSKIVLTTYGRTTGLAVDPIEKKPLYHFYPGSKVLSLGSIGCNLACRFCQNWSTSRSNDFSLLAVDVTPEEIVRKAKETGCRSVAFTYNEPITWAEFAVDVADACRKAGIKTVAVSNGYISETKRGWFFNAMDAVNIDLKSFSDDFYRKQCSASLEPVKETLIYLVKKTNVWLEITNLLIPTLNDSEAEIESMSRWIARTLGVQIPVHFSAFRPAYRATELTPTPASTLFRAREIAMDAGLMFVYTGNIDDPAGSATNCPQCGQTVISRHRFTVDENEIDGESCCKFCGQTIVGIFEEDEPESR